MYTVIRFCNIRDSAIMTHIGERVSKVLPGEPYDRPDRSDPHQKSFSVVETDSWNDHLLALKEKVVSLRAALEYANSVEVDIYLDTAISSKDYENIFCLKLQYDVAFQELLVKNKIRSAITIYSGPYAQKQIDELEEMKGQLREA